MRRVFTALCGALAVVALSVGCSAVLGLDDLNARGGGDGGDAAVLTPDAGLATTASKVDLLLVVEDAPSASDTALELSTSIGTLLRRLTKLTDDIHVGVISGSLGALGGDLCPDAPVAGQLRRDSATGGLVPGTEKRFLEYGGENRDVDALVTSTAALVLGVGQHGCYFTPAPLEAAYRFLVQPDPWKVVEGVNGVRARLVDVDADILIQRRAFLRPDSLVVVVLLTTRDDIAPDPRSFSGRGFGFVKIEFPGSPTQHPPRGTSACASAPAAETCVSCGCTTRDPACLAKATDSECKKTQGWYEPSEEFYGVRFWQMKQRFGVDPQFPIARYLNGFSQAMVPNRASEHPVVDGQVSEYVGAPSCSNPLFAAALPDPAGDLCNLAPGGRGKELVVFTVIGGVPPGLAGTAPDWGRIVGADPDAFDLSGLDPHMIQSTAPRAGLPPPSEMLGDNGDDPVHGREFDTHGYQLQYACTFPLATNRTCSETDASCDCRSANNPPICSSSFNRQTRGRAYPTPRAFRFAKGLGDRAVIGSACADYTNTMARLTDLIAPKLVKP